MADMDGLSAVDTRASFNALTADMEIEIDLSGSILTRWRTT